MKTRNTFLSLVILSAAPVVADEPGEWLDLFNGKDLAGWSPLIDKEPVGMDPSGNVVVRDGAIHMYANTPAGTKVPFGTIIHERPFSRFHLSMEYSWGKAKFAPRLEAIRDAGLLYHIVDPQRLAFANWPESVECQIQEGDTGDLVSIGTQFMTWLNPEPTKAPEGQGTPGMLPEQGGVPEFCTKGYFGRFPVEDRLEGWNTVEAIVQADESAVHKINGVVRSRLAMMADSKGNRLGSGKLGLQLEGAEILYRKIRIRELAVPLKVPASHASLSSVAGVSTAAMEIPVSNPSAKQVPLEIKLIGRDVDSFSVEKSAVTALGPNEKTSVKIAFKPAGKAGRYSAGLQIGPEDKGTFVILQGLAMDALEGENEPPLERIVQSLGIPLNVGGPALKLGTDAPVIGSSKPVRAFRAISGGAVRLTPLARFSPPGNYPFGWQASGESTAENVVGALEDSGKIRDAHQRLFPPLAGEAGSVEFSPGDAPFSLFVRTGKLTVGTDARQHSSELANPVRVYPVSWLQGRRLSNAFLVCFEEASNGDYQDCVFLAENVKIDVTP